jgi:hypothetical protein
MVTYDLSNEPSGYVTGIEFFYCLDGWYLLKKSFASFSKKILIDFQVMWCHRIVI